MEFICRSLEGIQIVRLEGSLTGIEAAQVRHRLHKLVHQSSPLLILDLSRLNFIDARGLSVFVSVHKTAQQHSGEVLLLNPTAVVLAMIELTRLQQTFSIYADEAAAVSHCVQLLGQAA